MEAVVHKDTRITPDNIFRLYAMKSSCPKIKKFVEEAVNNHLLKYLQIFVTKRQTMFVFRYAVGCVESTDL